MACGQTYRPFCRFSAGNPLFGEFNAVINRIGNHMKEHRLETLQQQAIYFDMFPPDFKFHFFTLGLGEVAHQPDKAFGNGALGEHSECHGPCMQLLDKITEIEDIIFKSLLKLHQPGCRDCSG